jgi:SAM-dependent methyltransferase
MRISTGKRPRQDPSPRETTQSLGGRIYALPDVTTTHPSLLSSSGTQTPTSSTQAASSLNSSFLSLVPIRIPLRLAQRIAMVMCVPFYTITMLVAPQRIRSQLLGWFIPKVMSGLAKITHIQRKLLLQHVSGRVLDVGSGGGAYLRHLKGASHVVCIEPIGACHGTIRAAATDAGFFDYQVTIVGDTLEEYVDKHPSEKFDWIILGNVLCEVPDQRATIEKITSVLKPGGHVYFCEHVASAPGTLLRRVQNMINPLWRRVSGGCNCNRDTLHELESVSHWDIISWDLSLKVGGNRMVMGLAQKKKVADGGDS